MNRIELHVLLKRQPVPTLRLNNRGTGTATNARSPIGATRAVSRSGGQRPKTRTARDELMVGFLRHGRTKRMMDPERNKALSRYRRQGQAVILPALTWLSLVGLLPSRAQLRFTRQIHHNSNSTNGYRPNPITGSAQRSSRLETNATIGDNQ